MCLIKLITAFLVFLVFSGTAVADEGGLYFIDAHSQVPKGIEAEKILGLMTKGGVKVSILSARGGRKSRDVADFAEAHPGKIYAAVKTKGKHYKNNSDKYYKKLDKQVNSGRYNAMGEVIMYHAQKGDKAPEVKVYPDDTRIKVILNYAITNNWPLVVHIEFAALGEKERAKFMAKIEAMLKQNSSHPFVLIHMGQLPAIEVGRLIKRHRNVYFMTSHSNPLVVQKSRQPWVNMFKGDALAPEWQRLVKRHPGRFIFALDNVWYEHWGNDYLEQIKLWRKALAKLPPKAAQAVAHGNAERLWNLGE